MALKMMQWKTVTFLLQIRMQFLRHFYCIHSSNSSTTRRHRKKKSFLDALDDVLN